MSDEITHAEIMANLATDSPLNRARLILASEYARIEQAGGRRAMSPLTLRRMEFEAIKKIAAALGVDL